MRRLTAALLASTTLLGAAAFSGCGDGATGEGAAGVGGGSKPPLDQQIVPAPGGARRLRARQYVNSIRQVLGEKAAAAATPPKDLQLHGFAAIGATELALSAPDVELYESSARAIAAAVVADPGTLGTLLPCQPAGPDDATCFAKVASELGRKLWRRSLEPSEVGAVSGIAAQAGSVYQSVDKALVYTIAALLQAPDFLYLVEVGEEEKFDSSRRWLTPLELASRMAYFLVESPPDDALLEAAETGNLDDEEEIRTAATKLLERAEARAALGAFYDEVFRFDQIAVTVKNAERFPEWTPALQSSIHASVQAFLEDLVWTRDADARTMLTADHAFVDANLAPLYGVSVPAEAGLTKVTLPAEQQRMGLLGSAAFLSVFSHAAMTSPTKRGVFIRRTLLCDTVPPPPPEVVPQLPEDPSDGKTTKELLAQHMKDDNCKTCHGLFDSLGWSLEKLDPVGRYRTEDKGKPIDTSGDSPNLGEFSGPKEMAELLAGHYQVPDCMIRNLYRSSMGHLETEGEEVAIEDLHARFESGGFKVKDLLVELVASPAFRLVGAPK